MVAVNQPTEPVKRSFNPKIETRLRREEYNKIEKLADEQKKSKSEVLREAALWYLDNQEQLKNQKRETEMVKATDAMADRICAMLARQGRLMATLFELTYVSMSQTKEGREAFEAALTKAKQKMAQKVEADEHDLVKKMKKVVKGKPVESSEAS
jgi:metal-responsive CopG/Arc/MetJ family transcriptional regulator